MSWLSSGNSFGASPRSERGSIGIMGIIGGLYGDYIGIILGVYRDYVGLWVCAGVWGLLKYKFMPKGS